MTHMYIGTKEIMAWPQDSAAKVKVCGVDCTPSNGHCNGYCTGKTNSPPAAESKPGYAVKYANGHISWSPKESFEAAYRVTEGADQALTFGDALHFLKQGKRVARRRWGTGVSMTLGSTKTFRVWFPTGNSSPHEFLEDDLLAEDWVVLG